MTNQGVVAEASKFKRSKKEKKRKLGQKYEKYKFV
jgi:hypothetical protein